MQIHTKIQTVDQNDMLNNNIMHPVRKSKGRKKTRKIEWIFLKSSLAGNNSNNLISLCLVFIIINSNNKLRNYLNRLKSFWPEILNLLYTVYIYSIHETIIVFAAAIPFSQLIGWKTSMDTATQFTNTANGRIITSQTTVVPVLHEYSYGKSIYDNLFFHKNILGSIIVKNILGSIVKKIERSRRDGKVMGDSTRFWCA